MIAAVFGTPGGPQQIELVQVEKPAPGSGEVLIEVSAAAVNPVDVQTRSGVYHDLGWIDQPAHVGLGWDVAGVVSAVGDGVDEQWVGRRVAGLAAGVDRSLGAYAEAVTVPSDAIAEVPQELELVAAATVPLNALTAHQGIARLGDADGTVLVTGAAGAVGGYALSFAADNGWSVMGLARESDRAFVESTGAVLITDLATLDGPVSAVFDPAGLQQDAMAAVVDGGRYVGVLPPSPVPSVRGIDSAEVFVSADAELLAAVLQRTASGAIPARVARQLPLRDAAHAHELLAQGGLRGRIVLVP